MANVIDTPDWQVGVVSAQALLAFVNKTADFVTVGLPPNCETLVVMSPTNSLLSPAYCYGTTTSVSYPGKRWTTNNGGMASTSYFFDVSNASDNEVTIVWPGSATSQWWVYSDAAAHLVADPTNTSSISNVQYVIPVAPSAGASDHPPVELEYYAGWGLASGTTLLAAPGASKRYRIFNAEVHVLSAGAVALIGDAVAGTNFVTSPVGAAGAVGRNSFLPSGIPLSANAAVTGGTTSGDFNANLAYTVETV